MWQYAFCQIQSLPDALNDFGSLGGEGFELVTVTQLSTGSIYAVFKRPIPTNDLRQIPLNITVSGKNVLTTGPN